MKLETDSAEYNILRQAVKSIKNVEGLILEIGTRKGGSLQIIINELIENNDLGRHVVSVDNYGHTLYQWGLDRIARLDYTNDMKKEAYANLYTYVQGKDVNLITITMDDNEFFTRYWDGVPTYEREKKISSQYAFVFSDGPHDISSLKRQAKFFQYVMPHQACIVFDDIDFFDVEELTQYCAEFNLRVDLAGKKKIVYRKYENVEAT